jgi:hypothetical protein
VLNELGSNGWEIITYIPAPTEQNHCFIILKRPKDKILHKASFIGDTVLVSAVIIIELLFPEIAGV